MQEQVHLEQSDHASLFLACQNSILEEGKEEGDRARESEGGRGRIQVRWGKEVPPKSETPQFVERV